MGFSAWSVGLSDMVLALDGPPGEASAASSNLWVSVGSGIHGGQRERRQVWGLEGETFIVEGGRQLCAWLGRGAERLLPPAKSRGPGAASLLPARPEKWRCCSWAQSQEGKRGSSNPTHGSGSLRPSWQALTLTNPVAWETAKEIGLEDL